MGKQTQLARREVTDLAQLADQAREVEAIAQECALTNGDGLGLEGGLKLARGIRALRQAISEEMIRDVVALQNTPLGFLTDKPDGGYPASVVRDVLIEALIRGARPVGNEINIISGRCYLAQSYFSRKVGQFPELSDLRIELGVPKMQSGGAVVDCRASWNLAGKPDELKAEIPIRVNAGMGADAVLGKAKRKLLARVLQYLTGSNLSIPDGEVGDDIPIDVEPEPEPEPKRDLASVAAARKAQTLFDEAGGSDAANS